jgi:hypothetical protein
MNDKTCKKGYKNSPVTEEDREKSRVRSRAEHIFGFMAGTKNGIN